MAKSSKINFYPVILAGGRGTRFWPLSRRKFAKQLLPLNSEQSMIQETVERLLPLAPADQSWIIDCSLLSGRSCLANALRLSGQKRVPRPPARMTG